MTIDSLMIQPERYKSDLEEKVFLEGVEVYENLTGYSQVVRKEDFIGFTYSNIYSDIRDQMVKEAVERKDYEWFGMTEDEFVTKSYSGSIEDVSVNPYIKLEDFYEAFGTFLSAYQLFCIDTDGYTEHSPLQEVW